MLYIYFIGSFGRGGCFFIVLDFNLLDSEDQMFLELVLCIGQMFVVSRLFDVGVSIEVQMIKGLILLYKVVRRGDNVSVLFLLEYGVDINNKYVMFLV